jgi:long-chain acyl-CoA synthetase
MGSSILLENGNKVYALARNKDTKAAKERVIEILKFWDEKVLNKIDNLVVLEGDITREDLGLDNKIRDLLESKVEEIFHCAAVAKFNWPITEIRKINVDGTKNILELGFRFVKSGRLKRINHLSTIFVYGDYQGTFKEDDLDFRQKFNNTYSQSKFEAEKIISEYQRKGLWINIFRPAIIVGESTTGKITSFDRALYQAVRTWDLEIFDLYPGKENYFLNITFIDELCKSIIILSSASSLISKNYHPFSQQKISLARIINIASVFLGFKKPKLVSTKEFFNNDPTLVQRKLLQYNFSFKDSSVELDSKATNDLLKAHGFRFSIFNEKLFFNQLNYGVRTGFFKKR